MSPAAMLSLHPFGVINASRFAQVHRDKVYSGRLLCTLIAGVVNGSYAGRTQYIPDPPIFIVQHRISDSDSQHCQPAQPISRAAANMALLSLETGVIQLLVARCKQPRHNDVTVS